MRFILTVLITFQVFSLSAQSLPSASTCATALNLGGCRNFLPENFVLEPGQVDSLFLRPGVNQGCIDQPFYHFSFFYFTAGADGTFAFTAKGALSSDLNFSVWGPIDQAENLCTFVSNQQPLRSSQSIGTGQTGLALLNPITGAAVTDDFDCGSPTTPSAGGDGFVQPLSVQKGKTYVILLDDSNASATNSSLAMNFTGTSEGVLQTLDQLVSVTPDTTLCAGNNLQLQVSGGIQYEWSPANGLSCTACPNPSLTVLQSSNYQVEVKGACNTVIKTVKLRTANLNLGPDALICSGAAITLNANPITGQYAWTGSAGLSCTDCPSPVLTFPSAGTYEYIGTLTTPGCISVDTIVFSVFPGQQPKFTIADNDTICLGQSVNLGGDPMANTFYIWSSNPSGFNSTVANPSVAPLQTTTYYLSVLSFSASSCPVPTQDSVIITVALPPVLAARTDTSICKGQSVVLGATSPETGVDYTWSPPTGLSDFKAPNPIATPLQTTVYTLVATNGVCTVTDQVLLSVQDVSLQLTVGDTLHMCKGVPVEIKATATPASAQVSWLPIIGLQISTDGKTVFANPEESTRYTATATVPGCALPKSFWVQVDSIPKDLSILPADTTICEGGRATLISKIYEPCEYPNVRFKWIPTVGQLTPDSLYNLVVQPTITTVYQRITTAGACVDTSKATVTVIPQAQMSITPPLSTICPGESVPLSLTFTPGVEDIKWTPAGILSCDGCNNPIATPLGTTTISVEGSFKGCPTSASAQIVVRPLPPYQFPNDRQLCIGESVTLNSIVGPNTTYTWTSTDPTFGTQTLAKPEWKPTKTATYFLDANNGCPVKDTLTISVESATLQAFRDTIVCKNFPVSLSAAGSLPGAYNWSTGQTGQVITVMPDQTTVYKVTYTYGTGCTLTEDVTVQIQGVGAEFSFPFDKELCPGDSVQLNSLKTPGAVYSWTSTPAGFISSNATPVVAPSVSTNYTLTATNGNCVSTQTVSIIAYNATLRTSNDTTVCQGEPVLLSAIGSLTGAYQWSPGGPAGPSFLLAPATQGAYTVVYTYGDGCKLSDVVNVKVAPGISVKILADPDTNRVNLGDPLNLTALVSPTQSLNNFKFMWLEGATSLAGNKDMITVKPNTTDTAAVAYTVIATSPNGCTAQDILLVYVLQPKVAFPNAFTPNGDALNNVFRMVVLEGLATIETMEVYNRWGQKVFSSTDPKAAWDGNLDGKPAPADVYAYIIRWRDGLGALGIHTGDVTLLR